MDRKSLGRKINVTRREKGLTSEKLSEICGINATYLRQIESGAKIPSLPVFVTICKELDVSPSYLLAESVSKSAVQDMDMLMELWQAATPGQLRMISAIIQAALEHLPD